MKLIEENIKQKYENRLNSLEIKIEKLEEKLEKLENQNEQIDSKIFKSKKDLSFLNEKLENDFNGKIKYNLIYRATRDGPKTSDFNRKCNRHNNQLIILKTTKGLIFGGYTGRGFQNTNNGAIKDDTVFLFSFDTKKIYNIKKGSDALYEYSLNNFGIFFGKSDGNNPIYLGWGNADMLTNNNNSTCRISNEEFEFTKDYELNNGEENFTLEEIEVFSINNI